jgi:hypothetical protein
MCHEFLKHDFFLQDNIFKFVEGIIVSNSNHQNKYQKIGTLGILGFMIFPSLAL